MVDDIKKKQYDLYHPPQHNYFTKNELKFSVVDYEFCAYIDKKRTKSQFQPHKLQLSQFSEQKIITNFISA